MKGERREGEREREGKVRDYHVINFYSAPLTFSVFVAAARFGDLDQIVWLYEKKCPWDSETPEAAFRNKHLHVLKFLHEKGCPWTRWIELCPTGEWDDKVSVRAE